MLITNRIRTAVYISIPVFVLAAGLRFYDLDGTPGEWYQDITIVDQYVSSILALQWPLGFMLSAGPLYHYLVAPLIAVLDHSYLSYKVASTAISLLGIAAAMLLGHEIGGARLGFLTGFVSAVSSWYLVFSRMGNSQIAVPLLTALVGYFLVRFTRTGDARSALVGAGLSALGLYAYPQTFVLPGVFLAVLAGYLFRRRLHPSKLWIASALLIGAMALPFAAIVTQQPDLFRSGYIGDKLLGTGDQPPEHLAVQFARNLAKTGLMLHVRGDYVFRSNPPLLPQLDWVSGFFFFLGLYDLLRSEKRRYSGIVLVSMLFLAVPEAWPFLPSGEVPSASRSIGVLPFVYLLVANGLLWFYELAARRLRTKNKIGTKQFVRRASPLLAVGAVLGIILALNAYRYFVTYAWHLPNHNVAFGKIVAREIDALPQGVEVFVVGIGWGEWGQPEREGIAQQMKVPREVTFLLPEQFSCDQARPRGSRQYFFWDPRDESEGFAALQECLPGGQVEERVSEYGDTIYLGYRLAPHIDPL